jgi:hypothetical protein
MNIEVIKSKSLLGRYNLLIDCIRKYHFIKKKDATAKKRIT